MARPGYLLLAVTISTSASAFELLPLEAAARLGTVPVHEALTLASIACANEMTSGTEAGVQGPTEINCMHLDRELGVLGQRYQHLLAGSAGELLSPVGTPFALDEAQEIIEGVLWPDDPTRLLRKAGNFARAGVNRYAICEKYATYGSCANRFCTSHFWHLQVLHAMAPSAPWCDPAHPNSRTCEFVGRTVPEGVELWVKWLVEVATGRTKPGDPLFATEQEFPHLAFDRANCNAEGGMLWWKRTPMYPDGMKVQDLLFTACGSLGAGRCPVELPPEGRERRVRRLALGALLHLIQDSFAQGHAHRIPERRMPEDAAFIACTPIQTFFEYTAQVSEPGGLEAHEAGDRLPGWDSSCDSATRAVDDPITAGAHVIRMVRDHRAEGDAVWHYLKSRVFVVVPPRATDSVHHGAGQRRQDSTAH